MMSISALGVTSSSTTLIPWRNDERVDSDNKLLNDNKL